MLPLLECIRDGARSVEQGGADFDEDVEGMKGLKEQHEVSFAAACTACRALRDLSALSKDFAAVVTDDILRVDTQWSTCVVEGSGYDCSAGGLISDLVILLKHANEAERFYKAPKGGSKLSSFSLSNRRQRRGKRMHTPEWPVVPFLLFPDFLHFRCTSTMRSLRHPVAVGDGCCKRPGRHKTQIDLGSDRSGHRMLVICSRISLQT